MRRSRHGRLRPGLRPHSAVVVAFALPGALALAGCFAISDLDRFHGSDAGPDAPADDPSAPWDLKFTMIGMGVHLDQLIEFRVIDDNNYIQARGVLDPVDEPTAESVTFTLSKAIPPENRPYRLDFYGDVNGTHSYDGLDTGLYHDHPWRFSPLVDYPPDKVAHVENTVQVVFTHNKAFTDIDEWPKGTFNPPLDTGLGVLVRFQAASMTSYVGRMLQVRVSEATSGHVVGVYRNPSVPESDFTGFIGGVVEDQVEYVVDVYVDANGNGAYDNPQEGGLDLGWRFRQKAHFPEAGAGGSGGSGGGGSEGEGTGGAGAGPAGLDVLFDPAARPGQDDVGEP